MYCAANPVVLVDPDGRDIETTEEGLNAIKNTVSKRDAKYIKLNDQGFIDKELLSKCKNNKGNMNKLKTLVNAEKIIQFKIDNNFDYVNSEGKSVNEKMPQTYVDFTEEGGLYSLSTKEFGFMGVAQFPGNEKDTYNSPNDKFNVTINKSLSEQGRAETTAHELYGHIYLKVIGKYSSHIFKSAQNGGQTDGNELLMRNILESQKEVKKHFSNRDK